jgi:hypothetical protein
MNAISVFLQDWQTFFNLPIAIVIFGGCMWILYSTDYSLTGNHIPLWHRMPLLMVGIGALWVATTCFADISSDSYSDMSYRRVGVLGELILNSGLAFIVLAFIFVSVKRRLTKPDATTKPRSRAK